MSCCFLIPFSMMDHLFWCIRYDRPTEKRDEKKNVHLAKKRDSSRAIPIKRNSSLSYVCVCVLEGRSFLTSYGILLLPISILSVPYSYFFFYLFKKSFAFIYSFRVSVSQSVCGRRTTVSLSLCSFFSLFLFPSALFVVFLFFPSHRQDTRWSIAAAQECHPGAVAAVAAPTIPSSH